MQLTVSTAIHGIDWNAEYDDRLAQNVANLIRCFISEVPYYRDMGVDGTLIHQPQPDASEQLQSQIEEMLESYAEGVTVDEVRVILDKDTNETIIEVDLSDGEEEDAED